MGTGLELRVWRLSFKNVTTVPHTATTINFCAKKISRFVKLQQLWFLNLETKKAWLNIWVAPTLIDVIFFSLDNWVMTSSQKNWSSLVNDSSLSNGKKRKRNYYPALLIEIRALPPKIIAIDSFMIASFICQWSISSCPRGRGLVVKAGFDSRDIQTFFSPVLDPVMKKLHNLASPSKDEILS